MRQLMAGVVALGPLCGLGVYLAPLNEHPGAAVRVHAARVRRGGAPVDWREPLHRYQIAPAGGLRAAGQLRAFGYPLTTHTHVRSLQGRYRRWLSVDAAARGSLRRGGEQPSSLVDRGAAIRRSPVASAGRAAASAKIGLLFSFGLLLPWASSGWRGGA